MTARHTRIYSRRGDLGETSLTYGPRVGKDQKRIVLVGTLDELSSWLGFVRAECANAELNAILLAIQEKLFAVGAQVATLDPVKSRVTTLSHEDVTALEEMIDRLDQRLPPLDHFVIPGSSPLEAKLHLARSVCRRAERRAVALVRHDETVSRLLIAWLNRLSDLLFLAARFALEHPES
ncbi:MAG: cob(I)yrinic acid a,c-diamide adenosyltransferase [Planctomycetia bacterium]|nr:cob(I)yrinic acid a,c-diamide adenosyltransferase [Planctomycetia bacterium]